MDEYTKEYLTPKRRHRASHPTTPRWATGPGGARRSALSRKSAAATFQVQIRRGKRRWRFCAPRRTNPGRNPRSGHCLDGGRRNLREFPGPLNNVRAI